MQKSIVFLFISFLCFINLSIGKEADRIKASAPLVPVDFYVMSKCPYASDYVLDFQQNVLNYEGLPGIVNITMNYVATVDPTQPSGFDSKHGQSEVWGDINELCVMNETSNWSGWWQYVYCMFQTYNLIPDNSNSCAAQTNFNYNTIQSCVNGNLGSKLLTNSIDVTNSLGWDPRPGSPTVYVNGQCIYGYSPCKVLDPSTSSVRKYICGQYTGPLPAGCNF
eukprot:TRINITY_DN708_c0_g1_i1.p1 TRINITY_DN708_c0_g1~~TRINITY_DN708_c0_g1_i1.p1  ORF type:complete len:222 (-),score=77.20 TRINITY_DN708_c0_g1_i1:118-783(-)